MKRSMRVESLREQAKANFPATRAELREEVERENMRFVPIKTEDQLDLQALHRVRDR